MRPHSHLSNSHKLFYILNIPARCKYTIRTNVKRKQQNYTSFRHQQNKLYKKLKFVNLKISALGIYDKCLTNFCGQPRNSYFETTSKEFIIKKRIIIAIKTF